MPLDSNRAVLAAAGSRKTEEVIEAALAIDQGRVLITTYTNENRRQIISRIEQKVGHLPDNIDVLGWFSFLIRECAKPYQRALTEEPLVIQGLNFKGRRSRFAKKSDVHRFFLDRSHDLYRDGVSDFVCVLNEATDGAVVQRLQRIYSHIFIDEVQDLVGYDLDFLDLLFAAHVGVTLVGDPRQHTLSTNVGPRNKKYRGAGLSDWLAQRVDVCAVEPRTESYRCNQAICNFADAIYPDMPATISVGVQPTGHDGVFTIHPHEVAEYIAEYEPIVLRNSKVANTLGLPALNIGVAKGSTYDRVLIFPTGPMRTYLQTRDPTALKAPERLYVAVTRARFSVAFVVPG